MILEFDAANRAAAERKATQSGMAEVLHCEHIRSADDKPPAARRTHRGEFAPRGPGRLIGWAVVLVILVVVLVMLWPRLRGFAR
jgi:hypothetical protein